MAYFYMYTPTQIHVQPCESMSHTDISWFDIIRYFKLTAVNHSPQNIASEHHPEDQRGSLRFVTRVTHAAPDLKGKNKTKNEKKVLSA
jgi:hypothetical protein